MNDALHSSPSGPKVVPRSGILFFFIHQKKKGHYIYYISKHCFCLMLLKPGKGSLAANPGQGRRMILPKCIFPAHTTSIKYTKNQGCAMTDRCKWYQGGHKSCKLTVRHVKLTRVNRLSLCIWFSSVCLCSREKTQHTSYTVSEKKRCHFPTLVTNSKVFWLFMMVSTVIMWHKKNNQFDKWL